MKWLDDFCGKAGWSLGRIVFRMKGGKTSAESNGFPRKSYEALLKMEKEKPLNPLLQELKEHLERQEAKANEPTTPTSQKDKPQDQSLNGLPDPHRDPIGWSEARLVQVLEKSLKDKQEKLEAENAAKERALEAEKEVLKENGKLINIKDIKRTQLDKKER